MEFVVNSESDFNGLFSYLYPLTSTSGEKYVNIEGTSKGSGEWGDPDVIIDPSRNSDLSEDGWCSEDKPNQYLLISLPYHSFKLTNYTFKVRSHNDHDLPTGWIIFGSIDKIMWIVIDEKENVEELKSKGASKTFSLNNSYQLYFYKYFKIYMTSNNLNRYYFSLSQIEFFGKLKYQQSIARLICSRKEYYSKSFIESILSLILLCIYKI